MRLRPFVYGIEHPRTESGRKSAIAMVSTTKLAATVVEEEAGILVSFRFR